MLSDVPMRCPECRGDLLESDCAVECVSEDCSFGGFTCSEIGALSVTAFVIRNHEENCEFGELL